MYVHNINTYNYKLIFWIRLPRAAFLCSMFTHNNVWWHEKESKEVEQFTAYKNIAKNIKKERENTQQSKSKYSFEK